MKKRSIVIAIGIVAVIIGVGAGLHYKEQKDIKEKYLEKEKAQLDITDEQKKIMNNIGVDSNKRQDKYDQSKDNYFNFSRDEVIKTRDMGIQFINDIAPYTYKGGYKDKLNDMKNLTTKGLGDMLYSELSQLQPALCEGFRKLDLEKVEPIQYIKMEDGSVSWDFGVIGKVINDKDVVVKKQKSEITLLFVKENNNWKIGDYSVHKYN